MRLLTSVLLGLFLPMAAAAFNADYRAAGVRLNQATTEVETSRAMADMARAAARSRAEGADLAVELLSQQSLALANDADFREFLDRVTRPDAFSDPARYADTIAPLLRAATRTLRPTLMDAEALVKLGDAIKKHDERAKVFGLPGFQEIAARLAGTGEPRIGLFLNALLAGAEYAGQGDKAREMTDRARRKAADRLTALLPSNLTPYAVALPFARDQIRWTGRQFDRSSDAIDLVTEAMETGTFDTEAYNRVAEDMREDFRRGPWDSGTYRDALTAICKQIGPLGTFCQDLFDTLAAIWAPEQCKAIDCDCDSINAGILNIGWIPACKAAEKELIEECRRSSRIVGTCHNVSGPAAIPPFQ